MKCENEEKTNKWIKASIDVNGNACINENPTNSHIHTHSHTYSLLTHTPYVIIICVEMCTYFYLHLFRWIWFIGFEWMRVHNFIRQFPRFLLFQYRKICNTLQTFMNVTLRLETNIHLSLKTNSMSFFSRFQSIYKKVCLFKKFQIMITFGTDILLIDLRKIKRIKVFFESEKRPIYLLNCNKRRYWLFFFLFLNFFLT